MEPFIPKQIRLLVLACLKKHEKHYCFGMAHWIRKHCDVPVSVPQVFRECHFLLKNQMVESWEAHPDDRKAGPYKVYYKLNEQGHEHARAERERLAQSGPMMQKLLDLLAD